MTRTTQARTVAVLLSLAVHAAPLAAPPAMPYVSWAEVEMSQHWKGQHTIGFEINGVYGEAEVVARVGNRVYYRAWRPAKRTPRTIVVAPG